MNAETSSPGGVGNERAHRPDALADHLAGAAAGEPNDRHPAQLLGQQAAAGQLHPVVQDDPGRRCGAQQPDEQAGRAQTVHTRPSSAGSGDSSVRPRSTTASSGASPAAAPITCRTTTAVKLPACGRSRRPRFPSSCLQRRDEMPGEKGGDLRAGGLRLRDKAGHAEERVRRPAMFGEFGVGAGVA